MKDGVRYTVEVKSLSEGRTDRVIPLLSQAILQAQRYAAELNGTKPMAVLYVEHAPESMFKKVIGFMDAYRPSAAIAIVTPEGLGLVRWNDEDPYEIKSPERKSPRNMAGRPGARGAAPPKLFNLFSDLNQWMLKVLLAPDIREDLLNAPRNRYRSGSDLAHVAQCSQMSASRLLQHLRQEGFLDEYASGLRVVRRQELFKRWRAAAMRSSPEVPMRFTVRAAVQQQLKELLQSDRLQTCLGLFSAADALGMGHVSGVPPYVYVPKLPGFANDLHNPAWAMVTLYPEGAPDLIVRQAMAPGATFKGAVRQGGILCADIIQVWLDVSNHPSRGQEQADHIYNTVLLPLINQSEP
nr:RpiR family transcriptional regulator [uncultured Albidiferax sp.]